MSHITLASRPFKIKSFFTIYYAVHDRPQRYVAGVISRPNYEDMIAILVKIKDLAAKITDKHMTSIFGELLPTSETSHFLIPFSVRQAWFFFRIQHFYSATSKLVLRRGELWRAQCLGHIYRRKEYGETGLIEYADFLIPLWAILSLENAQSAANSLGLW